MYSKPVAHNARRLALVVGSTIGFFALLTAIFTTTAAAAAFAKYDGIDGESKDANHNGWIDVSKIDWGATVPPAGQSRRLGAAIPEDMTIMFEYEKAAPKLLEACVMGKVIPRLEIELTSTYGGARATYLKYDFRNVTCTRYSVSGPTGESGDGPPVVIVGNSFEELKVTYTEYDDDGSSQGNTEAEWKVEGEN